MLFSTYTACQRYLQMISFTTAIKFYSVITKQYSLQFCQKSPNYYIYGRQNSWSFQQFLPWDPRRYGHSYKILPGLWYDNHWNTQWTKLDSLSQMTYIAYIKVSHFSCHLCPFHREKALCLLHFKTRLTAQVTMETTGNCWLVDSFWNNITPRLLFIPQTSDYIDS